MKNNGIPPGLKKVAAMCILKADDQFLLLKRGKTPNKGKYVPVGGKLDPFEGPITAVIRETYEETGIQINNPRFCGILIESSPTNYNWISYIYLAEIPFQKVPDCDEGELHWVKIEDLLNVPTPPTDWWIYKYVLENKPFAFNASYNDQLVMTKMVNEWDGFRITDL